jgi:hypothetical protein
MIQRKATVEGVYVYPEVNPAEAILSDGEIGRTEPFLNGTYIDMSAGGKTAAESAIAAPSLAFQDLPDGVESWVSAMPTNGLSMEMRIPGAPPWRATRSKSVLSTNGIVGVPGGRQIFEECAGKEGDVIIGVSGEPTDLDVMLGTRRHEQRHANDDRDIFLALVNGWDRKLQDAFAGRRFRGADRAAAEAELFAAVGGTPAGIAERTWKWWGDSSAAFHKSPEGARVGISDVSVDNNCDRLSVKIG